MWRLLFRKFTTNNLELKITEILKRFNTVDASKITQSSSFKDIGLDSLDAVEAVVAMEEILGIELQDEEAFKINSIQDAVSVFSSYSKN
jgi:NADH dehydrogenase (ubiquinone) 1 alpha/beta subcomplex 1, acyl-carrier protein